MFQQTRGIMKKFMQRTSVCVLIVAMLLSVIPQTNGDSSQVYAANTTPDVGYWTEVTELSGGGV